jgi:hypothetical protein
VCGPSHLDYRLFLPLQGRRLAFFSSGPRTHNLLYQNKPPVLARDNLHHCRENYIIILELSLASTDYLSLAWEVFPDVSLVMADPPED